MAMFAIAVILLWCTLGVQARPCPAFPSGSDAAAAEVWDGFPLADDGSLVLLHDVPFDGISVPVSWSEKVDLAPFAELLQWRLPEIIDVPMSWSMRAVDLNTFTCEVRGAEGTCTLGWDAEQQKSTVIADIVFPHAYATHNLTLKIVDSSSLCPVTQISREVYVYAKAVSLAPLLIVLILTPITREVYSSLGLGGLIGTWILKRDAFTAWLAFWNERVIAQITGGYASILWVMLLMGGIGGLAMRSGGIKGIGAKASGMIQDSFLGQAVVFCLGFVIFMDDYANTIIIGFSLQPVTEAMRISREKLAFLVDCTASPIAGIMPLSTWIAHELSQIKIGVEAMRHPPDDSPFLLFTRSISRRFYSFYMLTLVATIFITGRDWGFMYRAEMRARRGGGTCDLSTCESLVPEDIDPSYTIIGTQNFMLMPPKPNVPGRWWNAVVPFLLIVAIFTPLLFYNGAVYGCPEAGWEASARDIIGCADAFPTLHWTAGTVICTQIVLYACQYSREWNGCLLWPREGIAAALNGGLLYYQAMICLLLAFVYARTVRDLLLSKFLVDLLGDSVSMAELPAVVFVLCAIFSLGTGTSWGTMAVFMPAVLPLAEEVSMREVGKLDDNLLLTALSAVLGGAVWGDHCSPVSDTTILSAAASQCSLMDHAKTQLPYAAFCGAMAILLGFIPCGAGASPGLCICIGLIAIPALHYCITLLGLVVPDFGGDIPVFVPDLQNDGEGFIIGEGPKGTIAAVKNILGYEVPKVAAGSSRKAPRSEGAQKPSDSSAPLRELGQQYAQVDEGKALSCDIPEKEAPREAAAAVQKEPGLVAAVPRGLPAERDPQKVAPFHYQEQPQRSAEPPAHVPCLDMRSCFPRGGGRTAPGVA